MRFLPTQFSRQDRFQKRGTFYVKENDKANKSTWAQLKSGGSDLSCVTTALCGEGAGGPPL